MSSGPVQMLTVGWIQSNLHRLVKVYIYLFVNKKVLLCERKRHTASRVASARYAALCNGGARTWGTPSLTWGTPPGHGVSPPWHGVPPQTWGTPQPEMGYPLPRPEMGSPLPRPEMEYPPRPGMGYSPYPDLRWGTPLPRPGTGYPPPLQWWTDRHSQV